MVNESSRLFTKEMIAHALKIWTRSSISLIDVRLSRLSPDKLLQDYRLPTSSLIYTYGGSATVKLNEVVYHSERFGLFHGGKGTVLSIQPLYTWTDIYIVLYKAETPPFYRLELQRLLEQSNPFKQVYGFSPENPIFLTEKCQEMHERWQRQAEADQFYAKIILYQLIHAAYAQLEAGTVAVFVPDVVVLAKRYLDDHYREPVSIQSIAQLFAISSSQLSKLFKKREQISLQEYLNQTRLEAAKQHLLHSNATIKEIAAGCGFVDEVNLLRMFKKKLKTTPGAFRKKSTVMLRNNVIDNNYQPHYNENGLARPVKSTGDGEFFMFGQTRSKEVIMAAALSLMLFLSACGTAGPVNTSSPSNAPAETQAQATPGSEAVMQTRVVKTELGDVTVPAEPQRIVYLVGNNVGDILPFGKTIVGVDTYGDPSQRPEAWLEQWGQLVADVAVVPGSNLEGIMALEPDLIIGSATWSSSSPEQLSKIAPTIFYNEMSSLEERMTFFGEVFGMQDKAKELIAEYTAKVEATKQRLKDAGLYERKIVFVQGIEDNSPGLQGDRTRGIIYEDLDMHAPEAVEKEFFNSENPQAEGYYAPISLEVIGDYLGDADIIAYASFDPSVEALQGKLAAVTTWETIPAVKQNNIFYYSATDTINDYDYASRMVSLDTFVEALLTLPVAQK